MTAQVSAISIQRSQTHLAFYSTLLNLPFQPARWLDNVTFKK